jgi:hypothetical protein
MKQLSAKYKKRQSDLAMTGQRVTQNMDNNPAFPDPPAALGELKKLLPEWQVSLANAEGRDKQMVSIKNDKKVKMLELLQIVADYVTVMAKGDRTLILSSGFDATNENNSLNLPPSIEILEVELGAPGEAITRIKNVTGAKGYVFQYTTQPPGTNSEWIGVGSSQGSYTFVGLNSEKRYWFRVEAIGFNKQRAYSPVVSKVIQ